MNIGGRIKAAREAVNMTQEELGKLCDTTKQSIYKYENGIVTNIPFDRIEKIAKATDVTVAYIMGWEDEKPSPIPSNLHPVKFSRIPLVGQIACGQPILADEHIEDYVDLPNHIYADFALICKGDSMVDAGIQDGDVVYIRTQPEVETGQIAAVMVDGDEATLKRVYADGQTVQLVAANPRYAPMVFTGEDIASRLRILGLAVAYTHPLLG